MTPTNGEPLYKVSLLAPAIAKLKALRDLAIARRVAVGFTEDVHGVEHQLIHAPVAWGDPLFDYKSLAMTRRRGSSAFLFVYYSIHMSARTVFVNDIDPNPYGPLAD